MSNDTFKLPDQNTESVNGADTELVYSQNERESALGLGRAAAQLDKNLDREEFPEASTLEIRQLVEFGSDIEQARESSRNDIEQAA